MKTLYLLRHAKAVERQSGLNDIDRELDAIGLQNATRMGINLNNKNIRFDMMLSSPAPRAYVTASLIAEQIKYDLSKIHKNPEIYSASVRTLLLVVNQLKNEWKKVLITGHNPPISYLAEYITGQAIGNMTTCGIIEINFDFDDWAMVSEGNGSFVGYEYPGLLNF